MATYFVQIRREIVSRGSLPDFILDIFDELRSGLVATKVF
jgi:hypothetical protein